MAQVDHWAHGGHVARWSPAGADAWVGTPAMNAPIRAMASDGDVRWNTAIDTLSYDGSHDGQWRIGNEQFDAVIVAVPAEQVAPLIAAHDVALADVARSAVSDPCWTVMAAFDGPAPIDPDRLTDLGIIGSAVRNSAKPAQFARTQFFAPGVLYAGPGQNNAGGPSGSTAFAMACVATREDALPAPMKGFLLPNGLSVALLNPTPVAGTSEEDNRANAASVLIDDGFRFGAFGAAAGRRR